MKFIVESGPRVISLGQLNLDDCADVLSCAVGYLRFSSRSVKEKKFESENDSTVFVKSDFL